MPDVYSLFINIIGAPANDVQATFLYGAAVLIAPILIYYILYILKLITHSVRDI
jgi:hypothetical protein